VLHQPSRQWTQADLEQLIADQIEEGPRLEYKASLPLGTASQRGEAAKDVSALANSSGGRLIIGLREDERPGENVPVEIAPLTDPTYRDQLIDTLVGRCLPAVAFDAVSIPIEGGGYCLVVEAEESLSPVMVSGKGQSRYYHRVDSKSLPMGEREVRERYARMETRANIVDRLIDEAKPMRMIGTGAVGGTPPWFTLLLVPMFGPVDVFNPAEFTPPPLHTMLTRARTEMPGRLLNARPTYQGLQWEALDGGGGDQFLLRLHRSGVFEYHHAVKDVGGYPGHAIAPQLECLAMLDALDIAGGLYGLTSYHSFLQVRTEYQGLNDWHISDAFAGSKVRAPEFIRHQAETSVDRVSEDGASIVQATMDRVWQAAGHRRSDVHADGLG
jgi:hypothetical protein